MPPVALGISGATGCSRVSSPMFGACRLRARLSTALVLALVSAAAPAALGVDALLAPARDRALLQRAIDAERPGFTPPLGVTGITVPHHLLVPELIARGFWAASGNDYDRIILIGPDHYHAVKGRFGTSVGSLDTVFGWLENDVAATGELLERTELFEALNDISREHAWHAITPFIRHFWPHAKVIPILAAVDTRKSDWQAASELLQPLLGPKTLVVQSTDYSHYLPLPVAIERDQEIISVIASRDPGGIAELLQPVHTDSKASQFIQMALQKELGAQPVIVANRNSADYVSTTDSTTSYVVSVFVRDPAAGAVLRYADQTVIYFGGDVLLGRYLMPSLLDPAAVDAIVGASQAITGNAPLVVNLEGVVLDEIPSGLPRDVHLMLRELALPVLRRLGVVAVSLANNHSDDLGPGGFSESLRILGDSGIVAMRHAKVSDLGDVRVMPLGFVRNAAASNETVSEPAQLDFVCEAEAARPLIAFVHWGDEYSNEPGPDEREAARRLVSCGVSLVVGSHSHLASVRVEPLAGRAGQLVYSVGNYLFDQSSRRSSGAFLEVRIFAQGTVAARLIPIPNYFELGSRFRADSAL